MTTQQIITGLYFCSALASLAFVARYAFKQWWKTGAGRKIMGLHLVMVGFGISSTLFLILGPHWPGRIFLSIALLLGLNWVMWGFSWELEKAQRAARAARREFSAGLDHVR